MCTGCGKAALAFPCAVHIVIHGYIGTYAHFHNAFLLSFAFYDNTQFKNNRDEIIDSIKETKEKILKNSFFDTENKQVYINLSGDEWTHIIQGLIVCSAYCSFEKEPIPSFQDMISKDTTRIWKTE